VRPYPPGNFTLNSVSYPTWFAGEPTLTWAHRDRTQQTNDIVEHDAANIGPEAGVTYTLKIYDEDNTLVRTETGLTGTSYTYTTANETSDCGGIQIRLRFVLYAVRAGYDSWQQYDITVPRSVSPIAASAVAAGLDPTVAIDLPITPSPASAVASKADPTVVLGSLSITPGAATAVATKADPTVIIA
jgi:hypothetical protein